MSRLSDGLERGGTEFPTVYWPSWRCRASFFAECPLPDFEPSSLYAVLGFVFCGDRVALADIRDRGYCIPSGKIEEGEEPLQAMVREAYEETGARLDIGRMRSIGWYRLEAAGREDRICPVFVAQVDGFSEIPEGSESVGVRLAEMSEVPGIYFFWDELVEAVFGYAFGVQASSGWHGF